MSMLAINVTIDGERMYPCVVQTGNGEQPMVDPKLGWQGNPIPRWNGWVAYPMFDRATVEVIRAELEAEREQNTDGSYLTWDGEALLHHEPVYQDDPGYEPERVEPEVIDGEQRWCVGGCSWTWSEVEEPRWLHFLIAPENGPDRFVSVSLREGLDFLDGDDLAEFEPFYVVATGDDREV